MADENAERPPAGTDGRPNATSKESPSSHVDREPRATPRWMNFCPRPWEPMVVSIMRHEPEWIWRRVIPGPVTGDHYVLLALWVLNEMNTLAELEDAYRTLRPYVAHIPRLAKLIDRIYNEMWHHFLGGHS